MTRLIKSDTKQYKFNERKKSCPRGVDQGDDVELLIRQYESRKQFPYRFRIPDPNDMIITSYQHWPFKVKSVMPLNVQYGTAIPVRRF